MLPVGVNPWRGQNGLTPDGCFVIHFQKPTGNRSPCQRSSGVRPINNLPLRWCCPPSRISLLWGCWSPVPSAQTDVCHIRNFITRWVFLKREKKTKQTSSAPGIAYSFLLSNLLCIKQQSVLCASGQLRLRCFTLPALGPVWRGRTNQCVCFWQVTATRRRAAPSSTAAMPPPRRASSTTRSTWPCLRYGCSHTRLPSFTDESGCNYCAEGRWELRVNVNKSYTAAGENMKDSHDIISR